MPADSPFKTVDDFVEAWKEDPGSVVVGGGSSPGGPDHLFPMQLAEAVGIDPKEVRYMPYDGGGPLTSALLGNKIQVGFSGLGEFEGQIEAGELRVLAVSGEERLTGESVKDVPTLTESGHRPGLHQLARRARAARHLRGAARRADRLPRGDARQPRSGRRRWRTTAGSTPSRPATSSTTFLEEQDARVAIDPEGAGTRYEHDRPPTRAGASRRTGAGTSRSTASPRCSPSSAPSRSTTPPRSRSGSPTRSVRGRSRTSSAPCWSCWRVLLAVATPAATVPEERGRRGRRPDPAAPTGRPCSSWSASWSFTIATDRLARLGDHRGACSSPARAWALGSRTLVRDMLIGAVLSVGSWYAFYVGLGIPLRAGILDGVL